MPRARGAVITNTEQFSSAWKDLVIDLQNGRMQAFGQNPVAVKLLQADTGVQAAPFGNVAPDCHKLVCDRLQDELVGNMVGAVLPRLLFALLPNVLNHVHELKPLSWKFQPRFFAEAAPNPLNRGLALIAAPAEPPPQAKGWTSGSLRQIQCAPRAIDEYYIHIHLNGVVQNSDIHLITHKPATHLRADFALDVKGHVAGLNPLDTIHWIASLGLVKGDF